MPKPAGPRGFSKNTSTPTTCRTRRSSSTAPPVPTSPPATTRPGWGPAFIVVTPNKKANSRPLAQFHAIADRCTARSGQLTTCTKPRWAPVCRSSKPCATFARRATTLRSIEGIFSGHARLPVQPLYDGSQPFSGHRPQTPRRSGYTEPDPRDDLSRHGRGAQTHHPCPRDQASTARDSSEVEVESAGARLNSQEGTCGRAFMARLAGARRRGHGSQKLARRLSGAGQVLRYVGDASTLPTQGHRDGRARPAGSARHAFAHMALTDNIVRYETAALLRQSPHRARSRALVRKLRPVVSSATCCACAAFLGAKL